MIVNLSLLVAQRFKIPGINVHIYSIRLYLDLITDALGFRVMLGPLQFVEVHL